MVSSLSPNPTNSRVDIFRFPQDELLRCLELPSYLVVQFEVAESVSYFFGYAVVSGGRPQGGQLGQGNGRACAHATISCMLPFSVHPTNIVRVGH